MIYKNIEIIDYTYDGLGVGKVDHFPLFIEHVALGDIVDVEVTKQKKNLAFCKVIRKHKSNTVNPICPYYLECGGCHIMHLPYPEQLSFKTNHVQETLKRIGNVEPLVHPCIGMEVPLYYRNKLMIPVSEGTAGLYQKGSHKIVDMDQCYLLDPLSFQLVTFLKKYDEIDHVMIRNNHAKTEYMVVIVTKKPIRADLVTPLLNEFSNVTSIINSLNPTASNVVIQDNYQVLYGKDEYKETLLGNNYRINHKSFFQINHEQTEKLYKTAIEAFDVSGKTVIDAYSGLGSIGLSFAKKAKKVYAIESNKSAVEQGKQIAKENGIDSIEFIHAKSEDVIQDYATRGVDLLIVDPPRKGCDNTFLDVVKKARIKEFVYVSCNISTLARDIDYVKDVYEVIEVTPVDMFPQTYHVETVAKLVLKKETQPI